jgi:hypothetical protein
VRRARPSTAYILNTRRQGAIVRFLAPLPNLKMATALIADYFIYPSVRLFLVFRLLDIVQAYA